MIICDAMHLLKQINFTENFLVLIFFAMLFELKSQYTTQNITKHTTTK